MSAGFDTVDIGGLSVDITTERTCADACTGKQDVAAKTSCHILACGIEIGLVQNKLRCRFAIDINALAVVHINTEADEFRLPLCTVTVDGIVGGKGLIAPLVLDTVDVRVAVFAIPDLHESSRARGEGPLRGDCRTRYAESDGGAGWDVSDEGEFIGDEVTIEIVELGRELRPVPVSDNSRLDADGLFAEGLIQVDDNGDIVTIGGGRIGDLDFQHLSIGDQWQQCQEDDYSFHSCGITSNR